MQHTVPVTPKYRIEQLDDLSRIKSTDWDYLNQQNNPFLLYDFLHGLEKHDCLNEQGWYPCHLVVYADDMLAGAIPLYFKSDSYGEFVFDWAWAEAYERAGGSYYPKLVSAIPFSPVYGPRILTNPDYADSLVIKNLLFDGINELINRNKLSSFHCLFADEEDIHFFSDKQLLQRKTCQFHWFNRDYRDFQDFLDDLSSKKRKQIKRERRTIQDNKIDIEVLNGAQISEVQWQSFYQFYCSTFYRRWGNPRLTLDFFYSLSEQLPEETLLIMAKQDKAYIAGAFAVLGRETLFGRHWGCSKNLPYLHFELCYYQTIEYCIRNGLKSVDAGVQGEHKLSRGFYPIGMWSSHHIRHTGFRDAIGEYLDRETSQIDLYIDELKNHLPFKSR